MPCTALTPVFHNVTTIGIEDVAPRPVGGNASPAHVITKVDGVTVDMAAAYLGDAL
jgi:hypothetical protein